MLGGDVNPYSIVLLVNYWEIRPSQMSARLDELLKRGVRQLATFVPWQAVESDISHTLIRFLQAIADRHMTVLLILSPEVGVHYPHSGLPKDVISRKENMAEHCQSGQITVNLPPNSFTLPSLFASDFNKRYYSFLGRMDGLFSGLEKNQPGLLKGVTAVLTGSFWKYYRSPLASAQNTFGGNAGDFSSHAMLNYRQRVEHFFSQREFMDPTPSAANRWKTRLIEETNRRWFYQQSEDVFRSRSFQMIRKRSANLKTLEMELFTPEADPGVTYSNFLQMVSGGRADFSKLSHLIDEVTSRSVLGCSAPAPSFIHWTSMGGFRMLTEAEKQFLILKSLLLVGGQGGGILMDESEWFSLSSSFRTRVEALSRSFSQGDFELKTRALYLAPHLWSFSGALWEELVRKVGPGVKMVSSIDLILRERSAHLLVVDPSLILTREVIQKLTAWAKAGRVVVLPRSQLYSEMARTELDQVLLQTKRIELDLGLTYRLHALGDGKLIIYDAPDSLSMKGEPLSAWQSFLASILSIAEIECFCKMSDSRLSIIPFERKADGLAVFVLNGTRRKVTADLIFPSDVQITDLGTVFSGAVAHSLHTHTEKPEPANRFTLDVPAFGILPMVVESSHIGESRERQVAVLASEMTRDNVMTSAASVLTGFSAEGSLEEVWN